MWGCNLKEVGREKNTGKLKTNVKEKKNKGMCWTQRNKAGRLNQNRDIVRGKGPTRPNGIGLQGVRGPQAHQVGTKAG